MNGITINSAENYLHIDNNTTNNPTSPAHIIEHEESVDIMENWYKDNNSKTNEKFNVVNVFSGQSNASTKAKVNGIIRKLCINDLETICHLEYSSKDNAHSDRRSINR